MKPSLLWHFLPQFERGYLATLPVVPLHLRCVLAARARIAALALPGIDFASVVVRKLPQARDFSRGLLPLPGIILSPVGAVTSRAEWATNRHDAVVYPVLVTLLVDDDQDTAGPLDGPLEYLERIQTAFRHQRLPGVEEVLTCTIDAPTVVSDDVYARGLWHSAVTLEFVSRVPRPVLA